MLEPVAPIPTNGQPEAPLDRLERRLARIERTLDRLAQAATAAPAALAMFTDTVDSLVARVQANGIDVDERLRILMRAAERLTSPEAIATLEAAFDQMHGLRALLNSGVLDPAPVAIVAKAGQALAAAAEHEPPRTGMFGALRALRDPDTQRALGFLLSVARRFGATLDGETPPLLPAAAAGGGAR